MVSCDTIFDFERAPVPIRADFQKACEDEWSRIARPGTWWRAEERVALAEQVRRAASCQLCATRKGSLSPYGDGLLHDTVGPLSAFAVDAVHRIVSDPGRLTESWIRKATTELGDAHYVELVGVVATVVMVGTSLRGLGMRFPDLPEPIQGEPQRIRPSGVGLDSACVPTVLPEKAEGDLNTWYSMMRVSPFIPNHPEIVGTVPKITRALTLVPAEQLGFAALIMAGYLAVYELSESQEQLLAATVSSYNNCFY